MMQKKWIAFKLGINFGCLTLRYMKKMYGVPLILLSGVFICLSHVVIMNFLIVYLSKQS